jgi:hypothetical protein
MDLLSTLAGSFVIVLGAAWWVCHRNGMAQVTVFTCKPAKSLQQPQKA